jgi:hypothetical protein
MLVGDLVSYIGKQKALVRNRKGSKLVTSKEFKRTAKRKGGGWTMRYN